MARIRVGSWSERGLRGRNEDRAAFVADKGILIIADGMGGHASGDMASHEAVDRALATLEAAERPAEAVERAIIAAHRAVSGHGDNRGTTLTVAVLEELTLHVAHVGDTRLYVDAQRITTDQGVGYVLEEFVGGDTSPIIQRHRLDVKPGTWLLLTTDGIHDALPVEENWQELVELCQQDAQAIALVLSRTAVQMGSTDNCTAIVALVTEEEEEEAEAEETPPQEPPAD